MHINVNQLLLKTVCVSAAPVAIVGKAAAVADSASLLLPLCGSVGNRDSGCLILCGMLHAT